MDLHNYQRQLERQIELIWETQGIARDNKESIIQFKDYLLSEGIGVAKIGRYLLDAKKFCLMLGKPVREACEADIRGIIGALEQTSLSAETKKSFRVFVRKFYRFLRGMTRKGEYPPEVSWISIALARKNRKMPEDLLGENEIKELIRACENVRDKALISALTESGARVSEIGMMRVKHVAFEQRGARLSISGKTGARKILVVYSAPYLRQWLNSHPENGNPEAFLWHNPRGKLLCYNRIAAILKKAARKAGINKRVHPHLLRHSRATLMAPVMSEAAMKQYFGWTQGSNMAEIYVHMSGKDTDEAILRANGIEVEKKPLAQTLKPVVCLRCGAENETTNRFCKVCSLPLAEDAAKQALLSDTKQTQAAEIMAALLRDPEVFQLIAKKLGANAGTQAPTPVKSPHF
jgi:site-specific recombinase XerD